MRAEIIAIGDEIITGQRLDTNTQWLAERLIEIGVEVAFHTTIGDNLADNVAVFVAAMNRADVVVITGGLGPTADDLTREALARAAGVGLVRDEEQLAHIRQLFASRGRDMPERNAVQAEFPVGATPIRNEHGTAPGIAFRIEHCISRPCVFFALPGVPAEMKPMWERSVAPAILAIQASRRVIRHHRIKCFGLGESQLEAMLPDLIRRGRKPSVGITVNDATITLRVTAAGESDAACDAAMAPTIQVIHEALGTIAYGAEADELEDVIARMLNEQNQTVAVAEWATAGLIESWLTRTAEADRIFAGGVTLNSLAQLRTLLHVDDLPADAHPDDSVVAAAAAEALRRLTGADYAIAVGAFPPNIDDANSRVAISIAAPDGTHRQQFATATHPAIRQPITAKRALNSLRLILLQQST
jgi:nicotinamide-nucleotide amidase